MPHAPRINGVGVYGVWGVNWQLWSGCFGIFAIVIWVFLGLFGVQLIGSRAAVVGQSSGAA